VARLASSIDSEKGEAGADKLVGVCAYDAMERRASLQRKTGSRVHETSVVEASCPALSMVVTRSQRQIQADASSLVLDIVI
jgi:hypothetical protein